MTQILAPIFEDAEAWIKDNRPDMYIDGVAAVYPVSKFRPDSVTSYRDEEENSQKALTMTDHVKGLEKLVELISNKELFVGGIENPLDLIDAGNWDVEVVDAYYQLVYHGEVIYG